VERLIKISEFQSNGGKKLSFRAIVVVGTKMDKLVLVLRNDVVNALRKLNRWTKKYY
jgi:ribosomal protein S5